MRPAVHARAAQGKLAGSQDGEPMPDAPHADLRRERSRRTCESSCEAGWSAQVAAAVYLRAHGAFRGVPEAC